MANEIKQLASFAVLSVNGGDRISFTYDILDGDTGDVISSNNKESFFCVDNTLRTEIDAIRTYIREHKLSEEA